MAWIARPFYYKTCRGDCAVPAPVKRNSAPIEASPAPESTWPLAIIDRCKNRGQHAHIGLRPGNEERVDLALSKMLVEPRVAESGINGLVKYGLSRRDRPAERGSASAGGASLASNFDGMAA
jgi:hypothetical protein